MQICLTEKEVDNKKGFNIFDTESNDFPTFETTEAVKKLAKKEHILGYEDETPIEVRNAIYSCFKSTNNTEYKIYKNLATKGLFGRTFGQFPDKYTKNCLIDIIIEHLPSLKRDEQMRFIGSFIAISRGCSVRSCTKKDSSMVIRLQDNINGGSGLLVVESDLNLGKLVKRKKDESYGFGRQPI